MDLESLAQTVKNRKYVLIWDFDGTVVTLDTHWNGMKRDLSLLAGHSTRGNVPLGDLLQALAIRDLKKEAFDIVARYEAKSGYQANAAVLRFIRQNCHDYRMAVFSDNLRTTVTAILDRLDVLDCFEVLVCRDDVTDPKPSPEGLKAIYNHLPVKDKGRYLMIGNSPEDRLSARRFGIDYWDTAVQASG